MINRSYGVCARLCIHWPWLWDVCLDLPCPWDRLLCYACSLLNDIYVYSHKTQTASAISLADPCTVHFVFSAHTHIHTSVSITTPCSHWSKSSCHVIFGVVGFFDVAQFFNSPYLSILITNDANVTQRAKRCIIICTRRGLHSVPLCPFVESVPSALWTV